MPSREDIAKIEMYDQIKAQNNEVQEKLKDLIIENETLTNQIAEL